VVGLGKEIKAGDQEVEAHKELFVKRERSKTFANIPHEWIREEGRGRRTEDLLNSPKGRSPSKRVATRDVNLIQQRGLTWV